VTKRYMIMRRQSRKSPKIPAPLGWAFALIGATFLSLILLASVNSLGIQAPDESARVSAAAAASHESESLTSRSAQSTSLVPTVQNQDRRNIPALEIIPRLFPTAVGLPATPASTSPTSIEQAAEQAATEQAPFEEAVVEQATLEETSEQAQVEQEEVVSVLQPETATVPADEPVNVPSSFALTGFRHAWQTWNNCGPATLAMNLSYFGSTLDQSTVGAAIRMHPDDKNVNAEELAEYARSQGFAAQARVNGDGDLLRRFISQGFPVLIETWLQPEPNDGFGHYRLITGYDDATQRWIAHDSYISEHLVNPNPANYAGIYLSYAETDRLWAVYNRMYVLIYRPDQSDLVAEILGEQADPTVMWQSALARAQQDVAIDVSNPHHWFNLGSSLYHLGRADEAAAAFDQARAIGLPWRMLWYQFEPFAAYHAVGRYQDVVDLARTTLATSQTLEEVLYWHGRGLASLGETAAARQALQRALELNPNLSEARAALANLPG
jgi:tetratricopeptide (TPR) repeat protein